jgi:hypothetical protein
MEKKKKMQTLVESYEKSGMGPTKFAATKDVSINQLKYWVKKVRKERSSRAGFTQIKATPAITACDLVEIEYPNGVKIKVPTGKLSFLSQLIRVY